jgi:hypothetical protein
MRRSDLACVLVVGVFLFLLIVLSCRRCRGGKVTPAVTKPPRAKRDSKPFASLTRKPDCPVCEQEVGVQPSVSAPNAPPPRMLFTQGRRRHVEPPGHFCPQATCAYHGRVGWGNIRANGPPMDTAGDSWCVSAAAVISWKQWAHHGTANRSILRFIEDTGGNW